MEVLLINPFPEDALGINEATIEPPIGLACLASYLEKFNHTCQIIDANVLQVKSKNLINHIELKNPGLIGISTNIVTNKSGLKLAEILNNYYPGIPVIMGGPFPSSMPELCLKNNFVDGIVVGEGELTLKEIIDNIEQDKENIFEDVSGVIFKSNGCFNVNPPREIINDLDSMPMPSYSLLPNLNLYKSRARLKPVGAIFTSRGCPFQCIYCNSNIFGHRIRYKSPKSVLEEIDYLYEKFNIKQLDVLDDNFAMDRNRLIKILDGIIDRKYNLNINLQNGIRADKIDGEVAEKLKEARVYKLSFGVESGDINILRRIKKRLNLDKVIEANKIAKKQGIITYGNFMLGLPGDNQYTMQKTIDFAKKMNPDIANFMITIPFPGTELYRIIENDGKFLIDTSGGIDYGFYGGKVFYELKGMNKELILKYYKKAYLNFYFRPAKIIQLLIKTKSFSELKWLIDAGIVALSSVIFKR